MVTTLSFAQSTEKITNKGAKGIEKAYNDGKDGVKTMYGDVKSLAPELKTGLAEIAKGLKTTSERAWDILVLQQRVWSWCYLFVTLSAMYLWWRFFKQYERTTVDLTETGEIKPSNTLLSVLLFLLVIIDSTISGINFESMMTGFLNPQFGALRTVIEFALTLK